LRHSAVSVSSNTDLERFIEIAYSKTFETVYKNAEVLAKMLSGFRWSVKKCS
jgi:hypothetical protein